MFLKQITLFIIIYGEKIHAFLVSFDAKFVTYTVGPLGLIATSQEYVSTLTLVIIDKPGKKN